MPKKNKPLIHIGRIVTKENPCTYLFLRKVGDKKYEWFKEEASTGVSAETIEEAMRLAHLAFREQSFRTVICGFRYTLPERDEHGLNALFHHLAASHSTLDGRYFDEELGHMCFVDNPSAEALSLLKKEDK